MQILFHKKNPTEASITIKIEEADYQPRIAKKIKEHSKKANIKGFRPGSVPSSLIQQRYGRSILLDEVNTLLAESLVQYLKENEIQALGEPMPVLDKMEVLDWEHQRDFELEYTIGMAGTFACKLSKAIQVTKYKIGSVAEQTVDDLIEQLRKTHGKIEVVAKSAANDVIHGELRYPAQDFKAQTKMAVGEVAEEVCELFTGLSPGDKITFDVKQVLKEGVKLPGVTDQMYETMLRLGGPAEFTVEQIHKISPAALEQAFFDKVLGQDVASSEQAFKAKLNSKLLQNKQQEAEFRLERAIQATLLQEAAIALPDDFLKRWLQKKNNTVPQEQIETYYQQYAKELQWGLLIDKLSKEHSLEVTHEEVRNEVQQRFQAALGNSEVSQPLLEEHLAQLTQNFLKENKGKHYRQVYENVRARKLLNFVKDQITIVTQEVSAEAFDNLALE